MADKKETVAAIAVCAAFILMAGSVGNADFTGYYTAADVLRLIVAGGLILPVILWITSRERHDN